MVGFSSGLLKQGLPKAADAGPPPLQLGEVMVFSGSAGHARSADDAELARVAARCIAESHGRLADDASLVKDVKETLAGSPSQPVWSEASARVEGVWRGATR